MVLSYARAAFFRQSRAVLLAAALLAACAASANWRFDDVPRVVAVSDAHGAAAAFARTLQAAGLVDAEQRWTGGETHLVITGDLLDRGADSRTVMDLVMRLEEESQQAGGSVHFLLGNHEVMNLVGDLRYVDTGEYAAFADEETATERDHWFELFAARAAGEDRGTLRAQFDRARPPGFFAHRRAFAADGQYGRWLLQKPLLVVVNGTAFLHGGLSPGVSQLGVEQINLAMQDELANYVSALGVLQGAGLLLPGDNFYAHRKILADLPEDASRASTVTAALQIIGYDAAHSIHAPDGPLWYRGNVGCPAVLESSRLDTALAAADAERLVIGHTPTVNRDVVTRLDGRLFEIDTGMQSAYYGGSGHALVLDGETVSVLTEHGEVSLPRPDDRLNGSAGTSDDELESLLRESPVTLGEGRPDGGIAATLMHGERALPAVFEPLAKREVPGDLFAYEIDRLLGLQMVPATVERTLDGQEGLLRLLPGGLVTEQQRQAQGAGAAAWCPLPLQWQAMNLFDALIYNETRTTGEISYDPASWQIMLTGHGDAFGTRRDLPRRLAKSGLELPSGWRDALATLDERWLVDTFGEQFDRRQRRALLARRDKLLQLP